jgi:capsular polysaccharide biosynthesis protein
MYYNKITTNDDKLFYNGKLILSSLSINSYINSNTKYAIFKHKKTIIKDNLFIFIFNRGNKSGGNYFHFHFHYLQKLLPFFNLNNIKLAIPLNMLDFQKEILFKLVPQFNIEFLDIYQYNYEINNAYIGHYISPDFIPNQLFDIYQKLGSKYINNIKNENIIFIKRKKSIHNAGKNRFIINDKELNEFIINNNIVKYFFDDKNLENKLISLINLNPKIIIIEIGSGITNLLFIPKLFLANIKFIFIDQECWILKKSRIYDIITKLKLNHHIITCNNDIKDYVDLQNNPYYLNLQKLKLLL